MILLFPVLPSGYRWRHSDPRGGFIPMSRTRLPWRLLLVLLAVTVAPGAIPAFAGDAPEVSFVEKRLAKLPAGVTIERRRPSAELR